MTVFLFFYLFFGGIFLLRLSHSTLVLYT
jgi:hypothetical protein